MVAQPAQGTGGTFFCPRPRRGHRNPQRGPLELILQLTSAQRFSAGLKCTNPLLDRSPQGIVFPTRSLGPPSSLQKPPQQLAAQGQCLEASPGQAASAVLAVLRSSPALLRGTAMSGCPGVGAWDAQAMSVLGVHVLGHGVRRREVSVRRRPGPRFPSAAGLGLVDVVP